MKNTLVKNFLAQALIGSFLLTPFTVQAQALNTFDSQSQQLYRSSNQQQPVRQDTLEYRDARQDDRRDRGNERQDGRPVVEYREIRRIELQDNRQQQGQDTRQVYQGNNGQQQQYDEKGFSQVIGQGGAQVESKPYVPPKPSPVVDHAFKCTANGGRTFGLMTNGTATLDTENKPITFNNITLHVFKTEDGKEMGYAIESKLGEETLTLAEMNYFNEMEAHKALTREIQDWNAKLERDYRNQMADYNNEMARLHPPVQQQTDHGAIGNGESGMIIMQQPQAAPSRVQEVTHSQIQKLSVGSGIKSDTNVVQADPVMPMRPNLVALPVAPKYSSKIYKGAGIRNSFETSFEMSVNGRSEASMRCKKTPHEIVEQSSARGEGTSYGGASKSKSKAFTFTQRHYESWCDSQNVEGTLNLPALGGVQNVTCARIEGDKNALETYFSKYEN